MVRQCMVEEKLSEYVDTILQNRVHAEVGLVVGHAGTARDFIFFLVRGPAQAAAVPTQPAGKKQAKGRTTAPDVSLTLDADWLAEHASQVAGLLPGGVSVLGFYLVASEQAYASALPQLCNLADGLRDGSGTMGGRGGGGSPPMLLHVSATMGKLTAKEVPSGAAAAASLRPVELKTGPVLYNFMAVSCQYRVDCWAPIPQRGESLAAECDRMVERELERVAGAVVAAAGRPLSQSQTVTEAMAGSAASGEVTRLTLYSSPVSPTDPGAFACGRLRLAGTISGLTYVHRRDAAPAAAEALKADVAASLRSRLSSMREEAEAAAGAAASAVDKGGQGHALLAPPPGGSFVVQEMPVRVFMPTQAGVTVCEYLLEGDTWQDAVSRAHELLGGQVAADAEILQRESGARAGGDKSFWNAQGSAHRVVSASTKAVAVPQLSCSPATTVALTAAAVVALCGWLASQHIFEIL